MSPKVVFLHKFLRVVGITPFQLHPQEIIKFSYFGLLYNVILTVLYSVLFSKTIRTRAKTLLPKDTLIAIILDGMTLTLQFLAVVTSWMTAALRQNRLRNIFHDFRRINETGRVLNIGRNYKRIVRRLNRYVAVTSMLYLALFTYDNVSLSNYSEAFSRSLDTWLLFNPPHLVLHLSQGIFVIAMGVIRERFRSLNRSLEKLPKMALKGRDFDDELRKLHHSELSSTLGTKLRIIAQLHTDLSDLTERVADFFATVILIAIGSHFAQTLAGIYEICLFLRTGISLSWLDISRVCMTIVWLTIDVLESIAISGTCGLTAEEANNTGNVLHKMWIDWEPKECKDLIQIFSFQMLQRELKISLHGFFDLNFVFFYQICATVTTYLVIMIQLDDYKSPDNTTITP